MSIPAYQPIDHIIDLIHDEALRGTDLRDALLAAPKEQVRAIEDFFIKVRRDRYQKQMDRIEAERTKK